MNLTTKITRSAAIIFALGIAISSCQKLTHPGLSSNYPKDANPPGGPLKFYAAMDGTDSNLALATVDSIRANFGIATDISMASGGGVSGNAVQFDGTKNGFVSYSSPNDFGNSTDFTVSFWIKITLAQKDNVNADGVLAFANTKNFWSNICVYADHTTGGNSDSMDLKFHFNAKGNGDVWDAAGYTGAARWPHMYDGVWHNVAITYTNADSLYTAYRDGVQFDQKTLSHQIVFENGSQLILGGFQEAAGIYDKYSNNTWMSGFPGLMDNVRLYGVALSASDVAAIYANKQ